MVFEVPRTTYKRLDAKTGTPLTVVLAFIINNSPLWQCPLALVDLSHGCGLHFAPYRR